MTSSRESPSNALESRERILQSVYDHLMRSVVVVYASNMHEMIKTGGISAPELQTPSSRQELFSSLYQGKTPDEIQAELDAYATEIPIRKSRKRKLRQATPATNAKGAVGSDEENKDDEDNDDEDDKDEDFKEEGAEEGDKAAKAAKPFEHPVTSAPSSGNQDQQPPGVDIWGRIPPKEPKIPVQCTLCGRHMSTSRFASHLEKCMGLSTRPLPGVPNRNNNASSSLK